ncbi:MAG: GNAT family N-acetyltransferase [Gaiellaceae bacterium]
MSSLPDVLRAPTPDDAEAIAALFATRRSTDAREVRSWFANPRFDVANDFRVAERTGRIVGYADIQLEADRVSIDWTANDSDAGNALLDWTETRARDAGIDRLVAHEWPNSEGVGVMLRARGFTPFRASLEMQVPLDDATPEPDWPVGVEVRTVRNGEEPRVHALLEEAFADVHDFRPTPFEEWASWWEGRKRLDLWFAAEAGGELAGLALCDEERAGAPGLGWVESLAVGREWRRRGLGRALLLHAFRALAVHGRTAAGLSVQADNPTGAVQLYEAVGMHAVGRRTIYEKRLSGASAL